LLRRSLAHHLEARGAAAHHLQQARRGRGGVLHRRQRSRAHEAFHSLRRAHFLALGQQHHAKGRVLRQAMADHVEVAHLEYLQRQYAIREQDRAEREQR
jgi:hypothetical protein